MYSNVSSETDTGVAIIYGYAGGSYKPFYSRTTHNPAGIVPPHMHGVYLGTSPINAVRFMWNGSGNFDAGTYAVYGGR